MADLDPYSALIGDVPTDTESRMALINALRNRNTAGMIGVASGDPILGALGKNFMSSSDTEANEIGGRLHQQEALAQQKEFQGSQEQNMKATQAHEEAVLKETIRQHDLENAQKMWAMGIDPGTGQKDPTWQSTVDQIRNYDRPPLNASATRNPRNFSIMEAVHEDPNYHEDQWKRLTDTVDSFDPKNANGRLMKSADVGIHHLSAFDEQIDRLHNSPVKMINDGANWLKTQFGLSTAPNSFEAMKTVVSTEINKFIDGGGTGAGALADRQSLAADMDAAKSPALLHDVTKKWRGLMSDQVNGLRQSYQAGTLGKRGDIGDSLSHETRQILGMESPTSGVIPRGAAGTAPVQRPLGDITIKKVE